jgi:hypothetical protein
LNLGPTDYESTLTTKKINNLPRQNPAKRSRVRNPDAKKQGDSIPKDGEQWGTTVNIGTTIEIGQQAASLHDGKRLLWSKHGLRT